MCLFEEETQRRKLNQLVVPAEVLNQSSEAHKTELIPQFSLFLHVISRTFYSSSHILSE